MSETRSVFLYGKPTVYKMNKLIETQRAYTRLVNRFIGEMDHNHNFLLDLLNNNNHSPIVRQLEKQIRSEHELGSAFGQNAVDMAVKELHNHVVRIRNTVYGFVQQYHPEMTSYISYLSLLNASILNTNEIDVIEHLINHEQSKKKPVQSKIEEYKSLITNLHSLGDEKRKLYKETIANLFLDKLNHLKLPFVKNAPLQLDSRLSTMEESHSTKEDFVVYVKLLGEKTRTPFPVSTSKNSLRRIKQYKTGSLTMNTTGNGNVRFGVPFTKKVKKKRPSKTNILAFDAGITDLINTNTGNAYGTFKGMRKLYEEVVETKLSNRSSLHNKMKEYQIELTKTSFLFEKEVLRKKISHIATSLNGKKNKDKCLRRYAHEANVRVNEAVVSFVNEAKHSQSTCVYEDLDITEFDRGKKNNKRDSMWVRGQLIKKIQTKLDWLGMPHIGVDPAYTSKTCPKCSNIDDDNRIGKSFVCTVCKHHDDADHNASVNIEHRAFDKEIDAIVEKYRYSTKKRHASLKELFAKRHRSYIKKQPVA